jgi:plastocyanin
MWKKAAITLALTIASIGVVNADTTHAGGGCHQIPPGFTDEASNEVSMDECKFIPAVVRIDPGDSIQWTNDDDIDHMVAGVAGSWGTSGVLVTGETADHTFDESGVFPYFCEMHPGMVGTVVVGDGAAVSNAGQASDLAVSADIADAGAPQSADASTAGDNGFDAAAIAVAAAAALVIGGAAVLAVLRLTGRLPPGIMS